MSLKLEMEFVPSPLFRQNLRSALGPYGWGKLRKKHLKNYSGNCDTCGEKIEKSPHLHEDWIYQIEQGKGVAKIGSLKFVCFYCHGCEHFGWLEGTFAKLPTTREDVAGLAAQHYCAVNDVERSDFDQHVKEAYRLWRNRNKIEWTVDWGKFGPIVTERIAKLEA